MSTKAAPPSPIGLPLDRLDGPLKVQGLARYAYEQPVTRPAYLFPLLSTIATGSITHIDPSPALTIPGVLAVLTHENAPNLAMNDPEVAVLQSSAVAFRGQFVGAVVAETSEIARHAAGLVHVDYEQRPHEILLSAGVDNLVKPAHAANFGNDTGDLMDGSPADSVIGDADVTLGVAVNTVDTTYATAMVHHNPLEPHSITALWNEDNLTIYCSSQGVHLVRSLVAAAFALDPAHVRVISPYVGGGFGSKVYPQTTVVLTALASQLVAGRPVKFALTRQQMFSLVGYRPASSQRVRLAAGGDGQLTAIAHDSVQQTARIKGYAEQIGNCSRLMYAAANRRTTHRVVPLDLPVPTIMRGPGEASGMFALESSIDELAVACGMDPIAFRIRNEPVGHPESGLPFSSRHVVTCLQEGARRFGWGPRNLTPRSRREGGWLIGTGVASATYPSPRLPGSTATIHANPDGRYIVQIGAADIGTGAWTALSQIAAEALGVDFQDIDLQLGDSSLPSATPAGFSSGTTSWGATICEAARQLRARLDADYGGIVPPAGLEVTATMPDNPAMQHYAMHSFGAQFAEVRVREDSGEVRVPRLLGVFDVGRVINAKTARSQLLGGMIQGLSMALHEQSVLDPRFGHVVNHDFAGYHIATNADVGTIDVHWLDERDPLVDPIGSKGLGEIGIVGTAAAIASAVYHATGVRIRDLPITLDKLLTSSAAE
jgi:xanthine dehydrogenase YagR molybdenum-binding subunit